MPMLQNLMQSNPILGELFAENPMAKYLRERAMGRGVSPIDIQGQQALSQGQAQQRSMVAGAQPSQQGSARRFAMQNTGNLQAQIAQAMMMAKLQERQRAQEMMLQQPTFGDKMLGLGSDALSAYLMSRGGKK